MKVFFDNCTPPRLAAALDGFIRDDGWSAVRLRDLPCGPHAPDIEWIRPLSSDEGDWIVITADDRIDATRPSGRLGDPPDSWASSSPGGFRR